MASARYSIFEPSEKIFKLNRNIIAYGLVAIGFICHYLPINIGETFRVFYILITFIIFIYYLITSIWSYEPLNGIINGIIEFNLESILVNEKEFKLNQLNDLHLYYEDYFGERKYYTKGNLNQTLQQGVKNYIYFCDATNIPYKYHFKINSKDEALSLIPFLTKYNNLPNSLK